jgi:hypothetical protein
MSKPENLPTQQPGAAPTDPAVVDKFAFDETTLHRLWRQYGQSLTIGCAAVLLVILAKGGWDYVTAQKEQAVRQEYAAASTSEKLKTFADAHAGHVLAGIARLRLADEAYVAGKGSEAVTAYEAALPALKDSLLADRARLGLAMAKVLAGRTADGETALRELAGQADVSKGVRTEAAYHLASLAHTAGRTADVNKYTDQIMQIDAGSPWAQRAQMLRLQAAVAKTPGTTAPATAPAVAAPAATEPAIKLNLPAGK